MPLGFCRFGPSSKAQSKKESHCVVGNLTPTDVYFGRGQTILLKRERIKRQTIKRRRLLNRKAAA